MAQRAHIAGEQIGRQQDQRRQELEQIVLDLGGVAGGEIARRHDQHRIGEHRHPAPHRKPQQDGEARQREREHQRPHDEEIAVARLHHGGEGGGRQWRRGLVVIGQGREIAGPADAEIGHQHGFVLPDGVLQAQEAGRGENGQEGDEEDRP
jgi:hypothetical protein